jgi:hypothetical protein
MLVILLEVTENYINRNANLYEGFSPLEDDARRLA